MSTLGNNLFAQYYAQQGLPYGYRRVEYLESTGTQYVDTGVACAVDIDWSINCKFNVVSNTQAQCIIGGRFDSIGITYPQGNGLFVVRDESYQYNYGSYYNYGVPLANIRNKFSMIGNDCYMNGEKVGSVSYSAGNFSYQFNILLFALNQRHGITFYSSASIYGNTIIKNNTLVRNFIPCVRLSDSKPGLYDLCGSICPLTGTSFYTNAGTGEFVIPT